MNKTNAGKIIIDRLESLSKINISKNTYYLEDVMVDILQAKGVSDVVNYIHYNRNTTPPNILDHLDGNSIVFIEESTLEDDNGAEKEKYIAIIPGLNNISVFSSLNQPLHSFSELKIYKKYFCMMEKDPSLAYIPFLLFCLETFLQIPQHKISEIGSYLKKMKKICGEDDIDWITSSSIFCGIIAFYSFELETENLSSSIYQTNIINVINKDGDFFDLFSKIDEYVDNPTKECSDKRIKRKQKDLFSNETEEESFKIDDRSWFIVLFSDFFDVLFFWKK